MRNWRRNGQTKNKIQERFKGHFHCIGSKDMKNPIGRHFNLPDHKGLNDIIIHILSWINAPSDTDSADLERDNKELKWIFALNTTIPSGLNSMDELKKYKKKKLK